MTHEEDIEVTELDLIYESHDRIDALINLLIKKEIISQGEYENELGKMYEEVDKK